MRRHLHLRRFHRPLPEETPVQIPCLVCGGMVEMLPSRLFIRKDGTPQKTTICPGCKESDRLAGRARYAALFAQRETEPPKEEQE